MIKKMVSLFFVLTSIGFVYSQTPVSIKLAQLQAKELKIYQEGIKYSKKGMLKEAMKSFDKVLKKQPLFLEAKLRKAGLYYDAKDFVSARKMIDEVITQDPKYDIEMYNAIGQCTSMSKDYGATSMYYNQYLKLASQQPEEKIKKIKREIEVADFRVDAYKNPKSFDPRPIEGFVNTDDLEYLPSLTIDGSRMIFTRRRGLQEGLYISKKNNKTWDASVPIESIKSSSGGAHTISDDGNTILFTVCDNKLTGYGSCDLYISTKENNVWSFPANMGNKVNTSAWDSQPSLIDHGNTLIFSSDRKGTLGGRDLWMIKKNKKGKWIDAVNLGDKINTSGFEESPFIHPDGKTLYFRSNGHIGMGASDIFYTKYDTKTQSWSDPINLGYPINTEGDEGSLFVDAKGETAYYATDIESRKKGGANLDIYTFALPIELRPEPVSFIKVNVTDSESKTRVNANYTIIDLTTNDTIARDVAYNGTLLTSISKDKNYALNVEKDQYYFHSENFDTQTFYDASKPFEINIALRPIAKVIDAPIVLKNIFFESGSAILLSASQAELDNLYTFLQTNKEVKIKIVGHTDNVGSDIENHKLSEQRAKAVQDALLTKGIGTERLKFEGKGMTMPIADNDTPEGRKTNRRTEFVVIK